MLNFTSLPPLSLYIHYPWCEQKCPYCDFNSHTPKSSPSATSFLQLEKQYIQALIHDLEQELPYVWGRSIHSIFIGGGTPSLMQVDSLAELMSQIRALIPILPSAEITMEANPGSADQLKFAEFKSAGVNRLSIGIQSFNDQLLQNIGRIHNSQQAIQAIESAKLAGFDNINLDLMYALPEQSLDQTLNDIELALAFKTSHLSHYQLTLEANTLFAQQPPRLPDDDLSYDMQEQSQQLLADHNFQHYEISAYAKNNKQCQHNLNYWQFGDYLGIGAGAHGKISSAQTQNITRHHKNKHPQTYINQFNQQTSSLALSSRNAQVLSIDDICFEFMLNSSRLIAGFDRSLFSEQTSLTINHLQTGLSKAHQLGLINYSEQRITPTQRGLQYLNELQSIFL